MMDRHDLTVMMGKIELYMAWAALDATQAVELRVMRPKVGVGMWRAVPVPPEPGKEHRVPPLAINALKADARGNTRYLHTRDNVRGAKQMLIQMRTAFGHEAFA